MRHNIGHFGGGNAITCVKVRQKRRKNQETRRLATNLVLSQL